MGPAFSRFLRVIAGQALAAAVAAAVDNLAGLNLPVYVVPLIGAALNAAGKWLRDHGWGPVTP